MRDPVELPVPPSANALWRSARTPSGVRVYKSAAYNSWLEPAVLLLRVGLPVFSGPVQVAIHIRGGRGFPASRDLDNCAKAVLDAARHAGRIKDDSVKVVVAISVSYSPPVPGRQAVCLVTVTPAGDGE